MLIGDSKQILTSHSKQTYPWQGDKYAEGGDGEREREEEREGESGLWGGDEEEGVKWKNMKRYENGYNLIWFSVILAHTNANSHNNTFMFSIFNIFRPSIAHSQGRNDNQKRNGLQSTWILNTKPRKY